MYEDIETLANNYKREYNIKEEIIVVLIVYEVPSNPCSERVILQQYFNENGIECKELDYPIETLEIKKGEFRF